MGVGCISESGTLPPPRPPMTERERFLMRRLLDDADGIEEACGPSYLDTDAGIRQLALRGHEFARLSNLERPATALYLRAVVATLRRAACMVDPPPQGIA